MDHLPATVAIPAFLQGGGAMGARIRAHDWTDTPFGPVWSWPQPLRGALAICLHSSFPTAIYWGPELRLLYNDAWAPILAEKHPWALGRPAAEVWSDIWHVVGPQFEQVLRTGEGVSVFDQRLPLLRGGSVQETWWNYSLTPILAEDGSVAGVFNQGNETTARVLEERRLAFRLGLEDRLRDLRDARRIRQVTAEALGRHLGVTQVGFAEIGADDVAEVEIGYREGGGPGFAGRFRVLAFGTGLAEALRAGQTVSIADVETDPRTAAPAVRAQHAAIGQRAVLAVPLAREGRLLAVLYASHIHPRPWVEAEVALVREVAERAWMAVGRTRAEAALAESEARFRTLADNAPVIVWTADTEGLRTYSSAGWQALTGQEMAAALGFGWTICVLPEDRPAVLAAYLAAVRDHQPFRMEYRLRTAEGGCRWVLDTATPRHDVEGAFLGLIGSVVDITERRQMEEQQVLLAREVEHRAKNALSVVLAALRLTRAETLPDYRAALEGRIATLARAQALLGGERWQGGADLATLIESEMAAFLASGEAAPGLRAHLDGPPVALPPRVTQPLAMALHELATNAVKHGALSVPCGEVSVTWRVEPAVEDGGQVLRLRWAEAGGPPVRQPPERRGFGTRVLDGTVRAQLGGQVAMDWRETGLVCDLVVPLGPAPG